MFIACQREREREREKSEGGRERRVRERKELKRERKERGSLGWGGDYVPYKTENNRGALEQAERRKKNSRKG